MQLPLRLAWLLLLAPVAGADMLALKDGRFLDGLPMERTDKGVTVQYKNGSIEIPKELIADYFPTDETGEFVPRTEEEREKFEKGRVLWKGRWIAKSYRDKLVKKELEKRRKRIKQRKERSLWRNRAIVKTRWFEFHHTLPDEVFEELQELFEVYFKTFCKEWGVRPSSKFGKATVNIYHNQEYYLQVSGSPRGAVGYYSPNDRDLHFFFDRQRKRFTVDVMFHETNHMITHMISPRVRYPRWLGEGMAEYYGASRWDPETRTMSTGHLQSARLAVLQDQIDDGKMQKLEEMIRAPSINATQYAWAWSLCHFLMTNERYKKRFRRYFLAIGKSSSIKKKSFSGTIRGVSAEEQIKALKKYLKIRKLEELEKDWHAYVTKTLTRREDLDWEGAGWMMMLQGERKKARQFFKKAIEAGSQSAFVYEDYALLQYEDRGNIDIPLKYLDMALKLDPLRPRAWALMARCKFTRGEKKEAERLFALARELDPEDTVIWYWEEKLKQADRKRQGAG